MKVLLSEDEVIEFVASFLALKGFRILACGGSQAGHFRFHTSAWRQKAPDLVAFLDRTLLVCEAKVRSSALMRKPKGGPSDYELMLELARSQESQIKLETEAKCVLRGLGITPPDIISVKVAVIAATPFVGSSLDNEVIVLELDPVSKNVDIYGNSGCIPT